MACGAAVLNSPVCTTASAPGPEDLLVSSTPGYFCFLPNGTGSIDDAIGDKPVNAECDPRVGCDTIAVGPALCSSDITTQILDPTMSPHASCPTSAPAVVVTTAMPVITSSPSSMKTVTLSGRTPVPMTASDTAVTSPNLFTPAPACITYPVINSSITCDIETSQPKCSGKELAVCTMNMGPTKIFRATYISTACPVGFTCDVTPLGAMCVEENCGEVIVARSTNLDCSNLEDCPMVSGTKSLLSATTTANCANMEDCPTAETYYPDFFAETATSANSPTTSAVATKTHPKCAGVVKYDILKVVGTCDPSTAPMVCSGDKLGQCQRIRN
jgi:hypothetical protein